MQHVDVTRRFRAPLRQVWDAYTDHASWKDWAGFSASWLEKEGSPHRNGTGCVRGFANGPVKVFEEVVEWDEPRRMAYRIVRGGLPIRDHFGEVTFEADGDGTVVRWRCRFDAKIPLPGLGWAIRAFIEKFFRDALEGLARKRFPDR